jgi:uncharacterized protein (TIGR02271 family)
MVQHTQIESGASVEATDGRFGTVQSVAVHPKTGALSYLLVRHGDGLVTVPPALIAEVVSPLEVRLSAPRDALRSRARAPSSPAEESEQIRIPIYEERLRTSVQPVELGEVRVHKTVERFPDRVIRTVEREELEIERVPLDQLIDEPAQTRQEGEWLVVPVMEEVLVVTKQLVLTEEIRIRTKRVAEEQEVYEILRREHVTIEDATAPGSRRSDDEAPRDTPDRGRHRGRRKRGGA